MSVKMRWRARGGGRGGWWNERPTKAAIQSFILLKHNGEKKEITRYMRRESVSPLSGARRREVINQIFNGRTRRRRGEMNRGMRRVMRRVMEVSGVMRVAGVMRDLIFVAVVAFVEVVAILTPRFPVH